MRKLLYITGAFLAMGQISFGQTDPLGQFEQNVSEKYKAQVAEAVKLTSFPSFKDTTAQKLPVSYRISSAPLSVSYRTKPLPPAQIAKVPVEKLMQGLVRVGVGLYGTPLAEAYWNSNRSSKQAYGVYAKHLSSVRGVQDIVYDDNGFSLNSLGGYYTRFYRNMKWNTEVNGWANQHAYYGVPNDFIAPTIDVEGVEPPSIWRNSVAIKTTLENTSGKNKYFKQSGLAYTLFGNNYATIENNVKSTNEFAFPTGGVPLNMDVNFEFNQTVQDSIQPLFRNAFIAQMRPHIETTIKNINFDFGLNAYTNSVTQARPNDTAFTEFYFMPEISLSYPLVDDVLSLYGGIKSRLANNTNRSLSMDNPFLNPAQTNYTPTFERDFFVGIKGLLSGSTSFNLKAGMFNNLNQVLYFRSPVANLDTALLDAPQGIDVLYDDVTTLYLRGELSVNYNKNLQISVFADVRSIETETLSIAYHLPTFLAGLQAAYTIREKIELSADFNYVGKRVAFEQELAPTIDNDLPGYFDANLGIQYLYNSRLSAFVNAYNLFSTTNTLYYGYDAQRVNVLFGIGYQF